MYIKKLHEYFDRAYLINLDSRRDRLEESILECNKYGIIFARFKACDGQRELGDIISAESIGIHPRGWNKGAAGICMSLARLFEQCQRDNIDTVLIMEDDIQFNPKLYDVLDDAMKQVPEDWESIFFGLNSQGTTQISKNVDLIKSGLALHCHAVHKNVFQLLIDRQSALNCQADRVYDRYLFPRDKSYVIRPYLAWQRPSLSSITRLYADYSILKPPEYSSSALAESLNSGIVGDGYKSKQQAVSMSQEDVRRNISGEELEQMRELKRKVQQLEKYLFDTNDSLLQAELALMNINNSITWRMAKKLHSLIDGFFPPGTRRRMLAKRILFIFIRQSTQK